MEIRFNPNQFFSFSDLDENLKEKNGKTSAKRDNSIYDIDVSIESLSQGSNSKEMTVGTMTMNTSCCGKTKDVTCSCK